MNREHREGYERGETERTNFRGFRVFHGKKLQWTLPLNFLNREQREGYEQGGLQGTLRLNSMNREQREQYEQGETDHTNFRGFRAFRG